MRLMINQLQTKKKDLQKYLIVHLQTLIIVMK